MRNNVLLCCVMSVFLASCSREPQAPIQAPTENNVVTTTTLLNLLPPSSASNEPESPRSAKPQEDMAAFSGGALVVQEPEPDSLNNASWLLRGNFETETGWDIQGTGRKVAVIELPERALIKQLEFDTVMVTVGSAKDIQVEMSDTSAKEGFKTLAEVSLLERTDNQSFPAIAEIPGRWLRLTLKSSYGTDAVGLSRFRALGAQLSTTPFPSITGVYSTRHGDLRIRQEGSSVIGCYEHHSGTFSGGVEGRVMKLNWQEKVEENNEGAAFMVFSADTQKWAGLFSYKGEDPNVGRFWTGSKLSSDAGTCPGWASGSKVENQLAKDLEKLGRTRLYGINFDTDSDRLREESKSTLDQVAAMLKSRPNWNVTIEGHTDSTASAEHNQKLSERRANAVRHYLESAGIPSARLGATGFGAAKPLAENNTALGRAQNRRVELVKR